MEETRGRKQKKGVARNLQPNIVLGLLIASVADVPIELVTHDSLFVVRAVAWLGLLQFQVLGHIPHLSHLPAVEEEMNYGKVNSSKNHRSTWYWKEEREL